MNPANKTPRKPKRILMDRSVLLAFKLKRANCQAIGEEFPWQTYAALLYDVQQAVEVVESNRLMDEILSEAHSEALIAQEAQHAQMLVEAMSAEINARRVFNAAEVFDTEEDFSLEDLGELVSVSSWAGMHITSRP